MQLIMNILHFFWELIMQKSTPGDGKPSKTERFRRLILFLTLSGLLVYSSIITERLFRITRSFIDIAKESSAQKREMVELAKQIVDLKGEQTEHSNCQVMLTQSQSNLQTCMTNKRTIVLPAQKAEPPASSP